MRLRLTVGRLGIIAVLVAGGAASAGCTGSSTPNRHAGASGPSHEPGSDSRGRPLKGTSAWQLARPATHGQIQGYALRASAGPGEKVPLRVSTNAPTFRVEAYRFGAYSGGDAALVWRSGPTPGSRQPRGGFAPRQTRTVVAPWRDSLLLPTTDWPPGAYVLKLVASTGRQAHVPFFVRSPNAAGRVALVAPVTTWQAYNDWGGYSLYEGKPGDRRAWAVSFDRPYPAPGAGQMMFGVRALVVRAERLGIPLAYFTNVDLAADPGILGGARGYVSMGHDEYWTPQMRQAVLAAREDGTNLAFFGANTMYWRIRLEARPTGPNRLVVGYRHDAASDPVLQTQPDLNTYQYRDGPDPEPENSLTGVQYECFPVDAPYRVVSPRWWGFAGTGVRDGTEFDHLVGVEADRVYPIASTPRPLEILSNVDYSCLGARTSAQSVYYSQPSGAGVFTAGTLRWTCALSGTCPPYRLPRRTVRFARQVTDNLLQEFARGPAGTRHPVRDNVDEFDLSRVNQVPAS